MKKYLIAIAFLFSLSASAQTTALDSAITLTVTKQTLWIYGYYTSQSPNWDSRKLPDDVSSSLGNTKKTLPDSLVTFTFKKGKQLAGFINYIQSERIGSFVDFYRKIYLGNPAIPSFTALKAQINALALLNTQQGRTAALVKAQFIAYGDALDLEFTTAEDKGIDWIKN